MSVRKFAFHDRVSDTPPECRMADLHAKCINNLKSLTVAEKQEIFNQTHNYKGVYKLAGWAFDFTEFMSRFIVCRYDSWQTEYAFNKTNIRNNIYTRTGVKEIHEIPKL